MARPAQRCIVHSIGFDYGTSHCAAGIASDQGVQLLPLEAGSNLVASMLWAPDARFELPVDGQGRLRTDTPRFTDLRFGSAALAS